MIDKTQRAASLRLKSYFSGTVEAAIELARKELGEDALLVHVRKTTPETRQYGAYEIVFGVNGALPEPPAALPPPLPFQAAADPVSALAGQVADLRRQLSLVLPHEPAPVWENISTDATLGRPGKRSARVMLVGPPGVGKTATLMKIAARYGVHIHKQTHVVSTDIYRVAAADQLQTMAAILGAGCDVAEPLSSLPDLLENLMDKDLVLIDSPGFALGGLSQGVDLIRAASACADLDVHLVLSASMKAEDALRLADAYSIFRPNKVIFTRVDETLDRRSLLEVAGRLHLPVSFLSTGQRVPEDIEPATRRRLADLLEAEVARPAQRKGARA